MLMLLFDTQLLLSCMKLIGVVVLTFLCDVLCEFRSRY